MYFKLPVIAVAMAVVVAPSFSCAEVYYTANTGGPLNGLASRSIGSLL